MDLIKRKKNVTNFTITNKYTRFKKLINTKMFLEFSHMH